MASHDQDCQLVLSGNNEVIEEEEALEELVQKAADQIVIIIMIGDCGCVWPQL